jgi:hypothetical protein
MPSNYHIVLKLFGFVGFFMNIFNGLKETYTRIMATVFDGMIVSIARIPQSVKIDMIYKCCSIDGLGYFWWKYNRCANPFIVKLSKSPSQGDLLLIRFCRGGKFHTVLYNYDIYRKFIHHETLGLSTLYSDLLSTEVDGKKILCAVLGNLDVSKYLRDIRTSLFSENGLKYEDMLRYLYYIGSPAIRKACQQLDQFTFMDGKLTEYQFKNGGETVMCL